MQYNYYQLYGLTIKTKGDIKFLNPTQNSGKFDVSLNFKRQQTPKNYNFSTKSREIYSSNGLGKNDIPHLTIWKQNYSEKEFLIIRYSNGLSTVFFVCDQLGKTVTVYYPEEVIMQDVLTYFLGPVIGCILRLKNKVCLHASVVNVNNKAIAFIGNKTAGKSTLIANFAALGYPILSDDIAVLFQKDKKTYVHLGYPQLRLWRNTIENLTTFEIKELHPVLALADKYYMPLYSSPNVQDWRFQENPLPLTNIYYLEDRNEKHLFDITSLSKTESFLKLKENTYADYMVESDFKKEEFSYLSNLVNTLDIRTLNRPNNLNFLNQICQMIIQDLS